MRLAVGVLARRDDPDGLALKHRHGLIAERQDDVAHVAVGAFRRQPVIALYGRGDRLAEIVEVDRWFGGGGRGLSLAARTLMRLGQQLGDRLVQRLHVPGAVIGGDVFLRGQLIPGILVVQRIRLVHHAPFVDGAGGADRDAVHAVVADVRVHDDIVVIVLDRLNRAGHLARIAADADFRVDQVLFDRLVHDQPPLSTMPGIKSASRSAWQHPSQLSQPMHESPSPSLKCAGPSARRPLCLLW